MFDFTAYVCVRLPSVVAYRPTFSCVFRLPSLVHKRVDKIGGPTELCNYLSKNSCGVLFTAAPPDSYFVL